MSCARVGPSILGADLSQLASECQRMVDSGADYLHLDVMDGNFVPNITFGHPVVKCLRPKLPNAMFDAHMMVASPEKWVENMADAGINHYTFHSEATDDVMGCIRKIREAGMKVGLGVKPGTPVEVLVPYLDHIDTALVMTVEPGFGGQTFMADMMSKVRHLRSLSATLDIEVDGGVKPDNVAVCAEAGANMVVSGTAVIKSDTPRATIDMLRAAIEDAIHKAQLQR